MRVELFALMIRLCLCSCDIFADEDLAAVIETLALKPAPAKCSQFPHRAARRLRLLQPRPIQRRSEFLEADKEAEK